MIKGPKLTRSQWEHIAKASSNIAQAIILFSLAAFFVPETVQLPSKFPQLIASIFFLVGLIIFVLSVIFIKKGK